MTRFPLTMLLGAAALSAQAATEVEPNDLPGQAQPYACGVHLDGSIAFNGDRDWYSFTLAAPTRVQILLGTNRSGTVLDSVMELHGDAPGYALIQVNDDEDRSWMSVIDQFLPAGTFYLQVAGYGASTGEYSLDCQCDPNGAPTIYVPEGAEPNGPLGSGMPTPISVGAWGDGSLSAGDSDWWELIVTAATVLRLETGKGRTGTTSNDTILYLRDSVGNQLDFDDDDAPGNWSLIMATLQPGTYYLDVQGYGGGNAGTYTLRVEGFDASLVLPESPEPNGDPLSGGIPSIGLCGVLNVGEIQSGDLGDWYGFTLSQDSFVDFSTWGGDASTAVHALDNARLNLYDVASNLIATDNDDFYDTDARLGIWLPAGDYFVEVTGSTTNQLGTYTLRMLCNELALYHTFTGGCVGSNGLAPRWNVRDWELPLLGTTLVGELTDGPAGSVAFPFVGFSRTLSSGGIPLPVDLAVLGAPGCRVEIDPAALTALFLDAQGAVNWAFPLPLTPSLAGVEFGQQAFCLDPTANGLGLTLSNPGIGLLSMRR